MFSRQATLIYNPLAGPGTLVPAIHRVADSWRSRGWQVEVYPTRYAGHATVLAREVAAAGIPLVIAAGGDGTLGEVSAGLAHSQTIMAPLPTGTGNSLAKEWHIPRPSPFSATQLLRASDSLAAGTVQVMDMGSCLGRQEWLLWAGIGVDSFLVDRIEPRSRLSKRLGTPGYVAQALGNLPFFPGMWARVEVDGQVFEGDYHMVTISNCRRYAGGELLLSPEAVMDDGLFEVWLFSGRWKWEVVPAAWRIRRGRHLHHPSVKMVQGQFVSVHSEPVLPFHTDGDAAGFSPFTCQIEPQALRVLVPNTAPDGLFSSNGRRLADL